MASNTEMTEYERIHQPWTLLRSKKAVNEQVKQYKDKKVVVILFNLSQIGRHDIEYILKEQRYKYENSAVFFKCIVIQISDQLALDFQLEEVPTILFYRNGEESPYQRLVKPTREQLLTELDKLKEKK